MKRALFLCWLLFLIGGCVKQVDPDTGQTTYKLDVGKTEQVEQGAEAAVGIMTILGAFWPFLLPVATGAGGAIAAWRKVKPKLTEAQTDANLYYSIADCIVEGIEEFKKSNPEQWSKLADELEKVKDKLIKPEDRQKLENVIRGLRGLPPKT